MNVIINDGIETYIAYVVGYETNNYVNVYSQHKGYHIIHDSLIIE